MASSGAKSEVVAVVTGASRGAGKGIALALGQTGATVYVTGRSAQRDDSPHGGTVAETAALIDEAGGAGVAVVLDHADDTAVAALFERIARDMAGSTSSSTMRRTSPGRSSPAVSGTTPWSLPT